MRRPAGEQCGVIVVGNEAHLLAVGLVVDGYTHLPGKLAGGVLAGKLTDRQEDPF